MKICMVSRHACMRVQKIAIPLLDKGYEIHHISHNIPPYCEEYYSMVYCTSINQYHHSLRVYAKDMDIFHVHNEPSMPVSMIKEICNKPVVLDVHDSFSARMTQEEAEERLEKGQKVRRITNEERNNFQAADALVFPSRSFADIVINEFGLTQPYIILPPYIPERWMQFSPIIRKWDGLVYEGRLEGGDVPEFQYCNYIGLCDKAKELDIPLHIIAIWNKYLEKIYKKRCIPHNSLLYGKLIKELTGFNWGMVGNLTPHREWSIAMPNKFFDYISAMLPSVVMNADEVSRIIKEYGIGIEVGSLEELKERWGEYKDCRSNIIKNRKELAMEAHIGSLESLYKNL